MWRTVGTHHRVILGIETSCDDTPPPRHRGRRDPSNVIASQGLLHARYGGVVPEIASRHTWSWSTRSSATRSSGRA